MESKNKKMVQKVWREYSQKIELPNGVLATYENFILTIKGEKGEISKLLKYINVEIKVENNFIEVFTKRFSQRQKKIINTYRAHINNMIKGVMEGYSYRLRVVYAKFPITIEIKDKKFFVKNFLGEKKPRSCKVYDDLDVKIEGGNEIVIKGCDKERCGEQATLIEQTTRITHFDRRVIQDGVYIIEKPNRRYCE